MLECSWDELINFIQNKCIDLNSLIDAHSRYLNGITDKGFLVGSKNQVSAYLGIIELREDLELQS